MRPATLRLLMRHSSVETTMNYYVDIDVAAELWANHTTEMAHNGTATQDYPQPVSRHLISSAIAVVK